VDVVVTIQMTRLCAHAHNILYLSAPLSINGAENRDADLNLADGVPIKITLFIKYFRECDLTIATEWLELSQIQMDTE
jgi:hypothetical protein